ncbi:MAG: SET domain-containing protein-lysine N-methyltransferase [Candidatus Kapaibacterium sp.]
MRLCVLLPDYSTSTVDYRHYDPPRDLSRWLPEHEVCTVFLHKLSTYAQLRALKDEGFDCFINLCEGYLEWDVPSIDVITALEMLDLPFTGPTSALYDPPKPLMKYVAYCNDVAVPEGVVVHAGDDALRATAELRHHVGYPLFVKPAKAGDSLGIDERSLVRSDEELLTVTRHLSAEYPDLLVERYVAGREFTVLVSADAPASGGHEAPGCTVYRPLEYVFSGTDGFKTYALKTRELHAECNVPCSDADLDARLRDAAARIFRGFGGKGYARMDFRVEASGTVVFLEVNFTCSVFYTDGYEGSADHILLSDPHGHRGFLLHIIDEGMARHRARQSCYEVLPAGVHGYGMFARQDLRKGDIVFLGEERSQRIVTKRWVERHWDERARKDFRHYAYPVSSEVYILWDERAENWAPQNHSCEPSTAYDGLNVVALRDIARGEELTLDYAEVLDETAAPFACTCGSSRCRGMIKGSPDNTVTARERRR